MSYSALFDLASIVLAINLSAPGMNASSTNYYARTIMRETTKKNIDPLLVIAIIDHESRWDAKKISRDKEDYGLMQVRAKYTKASRPYLLEGSVNISTGIAFLDSSREFCQNAVNKNVTTEQYLSCYQGSCGRPKHRCQPTKLTARVMAYKQCLEDCLLDKVSRDCERLYIEMPRR